MRLAPKLPAATVEIWSSIPDKLINQITAKQLATVVEMLDQHWRKAQEAAREEILGNGYIWSQNKKRHFDINKSL